MNKNNNCKELTDNSRNIRIQFERCHGDHCSYYVDANGLLKGHWGGYSVSKIKGTNNELIYLLSLDYELNVFLKEPIEINEYGFFYNIFSCKKYDIVYKINNNLYVSIKNSRFGLIDGNGGTILHTCYRDLKFESMERIEIVPYLRWSKIPDDFVFIVTTEVGKFLFDLINDYESNLYEDIYYRGDRYFVFKDNGLYGLMNRSGRVIIKPNFEKSLNDRNQLKAKFHGIDVHFYVEDDLFYGKIDPDKYDVCFKIGDGFDWIFITQKNGKYGLVTYYNKCIYPPQLDDVILYKNNSLLKSTFSNHNIIYVIGLEKGVYKLFDAKSGKCLIDGCTMIKYRHENLFEHDFIEFEKDGNRGYVTIIGNFLFCKDYDKVEFGISSFILTKHNKVGALNELGEEIIPFIYESVKSYSYRDFFVKKDGIEKEIDVYEGLERVRVSYYEGQKTYNKYNGSYAQDEMGYSDDDIDEIFDGDPSAYWNID